MSLIKNTLSEGGNILSTIFKYVANKMVVGITGTEIDVYVGKLFEQYKCESAPIKEYNFPGYTCISINDCMCHGIPNNYKFQHGDTISIDISFFYKGYFFDAGRTFIIVDPTKIINFKIRSLIELNGFNIAANIQTMQIINTLFLEYKKNNIKMDYSEIGKVFHDIVGNGKYCLSYEYGGHKIGTKLHMPPFISSVRSGNTGINIEVGDTFCFEPLLSFKGSTNDKMLSRKNGWEIFNVSGDHVVHYENTYIVSEEGIYSLVV